MTETIQNQKLEVTPKKKSYQQPKVVASFSKEELQKEISDKSLNVGITPQLI